ncbi:flagellar biosynthesis protein FlhF, partial [Campylobacter jejuni]|nr:flagellar biosynthesis protein FlhF [Campylobacter jejuni]
LVDTIGNSQYDQSKLAKTKEFLMHSNAEIDVNLVVSANTKHEDLMEIYKNFSFLNIDTLIITKFDETKVFGNIFSLVYETNIPLSFFSIGQEVPDDLEVANSDFLVHCILEGFNKGKNNE